MPIRALHGPLYKPVPGFLRKMRTRAGLTQRGLAAAVGRPQSWVQKCETAERRVDVAKFLDRFGQTRDAARLFASNKARREMTGGPIAADPRRRPRFIQWA